MIFKQSVECEFGKLHKVVPCCLLLLLALIVQIGKSRSDFRCIFRGLKMQ